MKPLRIVWSLPVRGERLDGARGDLVRARALMAALEAEGHEIRIVEDAGNRGGRARISFYRRLLRPALPHQLALLLRDLGRWRHAQSHGRHVAAVAGAQRADVIVETQVNFAASGALAARATGIPLVLDDCSPSIEERLLGAALPALAQRLLRAQARAAAVVVTVSHAARERLVAEGVPAGKIRLLPNGVDLAAYRAVDRLAARTRLDLGSSVVIGFAGSFQPWHRVDLLVRAVSRVRVPRPIHLVLVGDGPGRAAAVALARQLHVPVLAVGAIGRADLAPIVSTFDIGVVPGSNDYGQPMKILDYAAAAAVPVAPDLPPVREMLCHEVTGVLFPSGDVAALSAAIGRLIERDVDRIRLGERARWRVAEPASWSARARQLSRFLTPLVDPSAMTAPLLATGRRALDPPARRSGIPGARRAGGCEATPSTLRADLFVPARRSSDWEPWP
jgi:glycosyltransferase involved in cell wall biosynthesis